MFHTQPHRFVVFNRIPKCGSTSLVRIFETLSPRNKFRVIRFNTTNPHQFRSLVLHQAFVDEVTRSAVSTKLFVHGHFYYVNFRQFGVSSEYVYINCLREPLERLVSKYYFMRFGDDHRPKVIRSRMKNDTTRWQTFDDCVRLSGDDCDPRLLWVQIPFFCGTAAYCDVPGNRAALDTAKRRLVEDYLLVGTLDYFKEFVQLLRHLLPDYLTGITSTMDLEIGGHPLWHLRKTQNKIPPRPETLAVYQKSPIWQMEQEFFEFARAEFLARCRHLKQFLPNETIWNTILIDVT
ncbi:unnamed protein product [Mesocestoides corti]|nr:unnamed protein product [Mesocestoides corti]